MMPRLARLTLSFALLSAPALHAGSFLIDDFDAPVIDQSKWQVLLPTSQSSVTQNAGNIVTSGRGTLSTINQYGGPLTINLDFTLLSNYEHFNVAFRTDLSTDGIDQYFERVGLFVQFSNDNKQVSINRYTSSVDWYRIAMSNYPLITERPYSCKITDDGCNISVDVNGVEVVNGTSTYRTGGYIAFYSREFPFTSTQIDKISISTVSSNVPDSSINCISIFILIGMLAVYRSLRYCCGKPV